MDGRQAEKQSPLALVEVDTDEAAVDLGGAQAEASLQAELNKWRERVPRLAAALREKTTEMEALKSAYIELSDQSKVPSADVRLTELEADLAESTARIDLKIAEIAQRDDAIRLLQNEHDTWKVKCERVCRLLDGQSEEMATQRSLAEQADERRKAAETQVTQAQRDAQQARDQADSLTSRNAQLQETTDLANQQIHLLGEDLQHLKTELGNHNSAAVDELRAEVERLTQLEQSLRILLVETEENLLTSEQNARRAEEALEASKVSARQIETALESAHNEARQAEKQLSIAVADLQARTEAWHSERNELSDQNLDLEQAFAAQRQSLHNELAEQRGVQERQEHKFRVLSTKFIRLHEELKGLTDERETLTREVAGLRFDENERVNSITKAVDEAKARFEIESAEQLELAGLQQQKVSELISALQSRDAEISRLENCIGQAQEANQLREHERAQLSGQLTQTRSRLAKIEGHLDESSELINKLEQDNQELKTKLAVARDIPTPAFQADDPNRPPVNAQDDFTKIKGIGPKLAVQLHHLGVLCYDDIGRLDEGALNLESHFLHMFRSRIIRDRWIPQARSLSQAKAH